ncbi:FecR family protein [Dyadobacter sp. CY345]|uniref:FecR family protein n=1 Tax=Dyadobacter sp. CY345 TaxID=2909335 RepID=UPI001F30A3CE|nr:FecR family protein [Dyadobacter sp. CY345]MCF2447657.1 FecR family protein [Dyadobacter sp. CY345]
MSRQQFSHLLQKYHRGECTPQEKQFVENWFGLLDDEPMGNEREPDWQVLEEKMWDQLHIKIQESEGQKGGPASSGNMRFFWLGLAASIIAIASGVILYRHQAMTLFSKNNTDSSAWSEKKNTSDFNERFQLEDGSIIDLSPGSSVRYPTHFSGEKRVVFLLGKAFFDITKIPEKPFFVYSDHMVTRVLGTRFYVEEQKGIEAPQVEVVSGAVAVYENTKENTAQGNNVILKPNQKTSFFPGEHKFVTSLVAEPQIIDDSVNSGRFKFYNTPLSKVLDNLHTSYGIDIILENRQMATCPLTANLTGQPLYTQLDIICAALNASYKIKGTSIFVAGKGCNDHRIIIKT